MRKGKPPATESMTEAEARVKIDSALRDAGWSLPGGDSRENVRMEPRADGGFADYMLLDDDGFPLAVLEAKRADKHPLEGKEQARGYAREQGAPFVILSNGEQHFFWDTGKDNNPQAIQSMPTPESVARHKNRPAPSPFSSEDVGADYIAASQEATASKRPLRDYQIAAVRAVQKAADAGKERFLLEMATGTGKTMVAAALIKLFMRTGNARRVLFLVDRLELEDQAQKNLENCLSADYRALVYKQSKSDWNKARVVVSTVQSLAFGGRFHRCFSPLDFDLLVADEAHRCIAGYNSRAVFEYFLGRKIGLTATPHDFMKGVDLSAAGGKATEARMLRDTYETFYCKAGEPTFRYNLEAGAEEGHLLRPWVLDARTKMTTALLSKEGFDVVEYDEETGEEKEMQFKRRDFERKLFSEKTNESFCREFMKRALRDPASGEIGKTIMYCVSQRHAAKIVNILNASAMQMFPGKYRSDFAVQVTSSQPEAQEDSRRFANNNLNGKTRVLDGYDSSKTRVCVTVGMMTTGYDCTDLLNLCFMRPVFSPSLFVQMKGRGTRKHSFRHDLGKGEKTECEKEKFLIFDFFAVCEYFEKDFNYDDKLSLATEDIIGGEGEDGEPPENRKGAVKLTKPDPMATVTETESAVFRVDEPAFKRFVGALKKDDALRRAVEEENWPVAVARAREEHENRPNDYATPEKIARDNKLGRQLKTREVLEYAFGLIRKFKKRDDLLDEEARRFCAVGNPAEKDLMSAAYALKAYIEDPTVRAIIDSGRFGELAGNPTLSDEEWNELGKDLRNAITEHANNQTELEVFDKAPSD